MKIKDILLFFLVIIISCGKLNAQWSNRDTIAFAQRNGLPNFFHKIAQGQVAKVGFIGGSITSKKFYRPRFVNWLKNHYGASIIIDTNVAIVGADSKSGVFRVNYDLIDEVSCDLIIIEFVVNDKTLYTDGELEKSVEGLLRKIWKKNPKTDIMMMLNQRTSDMLVIQTGKMHEVAAVHDSIASHFGIPSLLTGVACQKQIDSGSAIWHDPNISSNDSINTFGKYVFTYDGIHPSVYGSQFYADLLAERIIQMESNEQDYTHTLPPLLYEDNYENAFSIPVQDSLNTGMLVLDSQDDGYYCFDQVNDHRRFFMSEDTNAHYDFTFTGDEFGFSFLTAPDVGRISLTIDGQTREIKLFQRRSNYPLRKFLFFKVPFGFHTCRLSPSVNKLTLAEKRAILDSALRSSFDNNPQSFNFNRLYLSDILINNLFQKPLISLSQANTLFCAGDSVILYSSYSSGNLWSTGDTSQFIVVYNSGTFKLQVNRLDTSLYADSLVINFNPLVNKPVIQVSGSGTFCEGDTVLLTASAAGNLHWSTGETTAQISVIDTDYYTLSLTENGCTAQSDSVYVEFYPIPEVSIDSIHPFCDTVSETPFIVGLPAGGNYFIDGLWFDSLSFVGLDSGQYHLLYTYEKNGCVAQSEREFKVEFCQEVQAHILEPEEHEIIRLYPNPANNFLWINVKESDYVQLHSVKDAIGRNVKMLSANAHEIDLQYLNSGAYFIEMSVNGQNFKIPFLIKHY